MDINISLDMFLITRYIFSGCLIIFMVFISQTKDENIKAINGALLIILAFLGLLYITTWLW